MTRTPHPDDPLARRLEEALRHEAEATPIPDRYDRLLDAVAEQRRAGTGRTLAVAAAVTLVAGSGVWLASQPGTLQGTPQDPLAPVPSPSSSPRSTPAPTASPTRTPTPTPAPTWTASPPSTATPTPASTPASAPASAPPPDGSIGVVSTDGPLRDTVTSPQIGFASPTGNIVCTMDASRGVRCHIMEATWTGADVPTTRLVGCDTEPGGAFGPQHDVILTRDGAFGNCVSELSLPEAIEREGGQRNPADAAYRSWAGPDTELVPVFGSGSPYRAYALPYDTVATAGDFSCAMETTGVTCVNERTGAGFQLSRARLTLG